MFSNNKKTIGVIIEAVSLAFPNLLCQGIIPAARKLDYNVAFFSAYGRYGDREDYFKGDCKIYDLAPYEDLDGVILLLDTIQDAGSIQYIIEQVRTRCHCPVVSIREKVDGVNNFLIDNTLCMEKMVRHFIEDHHFTKLAFMTGPQDRWYARERLDCFLHVMKEYNLPVDEHQIFYGDFWTNKGHDACEWFLSGETQPEAIICANDYMAISVVSELIQRGYRVPQDICVSGYDGLKETLHFSPSISTLTLPFKKMGEQAVHVIHEKQTSPDDTQNYMFDVELVSRESCGCQQINDQEVISSRCDYYEETVATHNRRVQFSFLSIQLGECNQFDEIGKHLASFASNITGYRDYCICLNENLEEQEDFSDYTDTMELRIGIRKEKHMGNLRIPFDRKELLPAEMTSNSPQSWYFTPLHFGSKTFGYEAVQFWNPEVTANLFHDWTTIVCTKIQDVLNQHKMHVLIDELQYMYNRDALTGLYSRRGFNSHAAVILKKAKEQNKNVFFAIVDMDGMKQINDTYGHVAGDHALTTISAAIQFACKDVFIGARTGGDEFVVLANGISEDEGLACLNDIKSALDTFNNNDRKPYKIHASFGHVCHVPAPEDTVETFMKESDEIMYKNKVENKRRRNEPLR
nr:GGDEF domain-containing protein [Eubacterium sp.]